LNNQIFTLETDLHQIVAGCRKGEPRMQKKLYEQYYESMIKLSQRYTRDTGKASLVYNDAMLKVFRTIGGYDEQGKLSAWIKQIVVNTAIDYVRVKSNFLPETKTEDAIAEDYNIDESIFHKMDAQEIRHLINRLPDKLAIVFNLYVYEEYDHNEIGTLLQIPSSTSRYYLSEARKKLKEIVLNPIFSLNKAI
jgi:RNA polymerase sigma-70 factor (ECF subfamily)